MKKIILFLGLLIVSINFILACININTASISELDEIKWVGPTTAQYIIDARPFDSIDDLIRVSGIGEVKLQDIKDQGLACVEGDNSDTQRIISNEEKINNEEGNNEIVLTQTQEKNFEEREIQTINLNPKTINSDKNLSETIKSNYILYGLGIFSIFILLLLLLRRKQDKNEFE